MQETFVCECCVIRENQSRHLQARACQVHFQLVWRKFQTQQGILKRLNAWLKKVFVTLVAILSSDSIFAFFAGNPGYTGLRLTTYIVGGKYVKIYIFCSLGFKYLDICQIFTSSSSILTIPTSQIEPKNRFLLSPCQNLRH